MVLVLVQPVLKPEQELAQLVLESDRPEWWNLAEWVQELELVRLKVLAREPGQETVQLAPELDRPNWVKLADPLRELMLAPPLSVFVRL